MRLHAGGGYSPLWGDYRSYTHMSVSMASPGGLGEHHEETHSVIGRSGKGHQSHIRLGDREGPFEEVLFEPSPE